MLTARAAGKRLNGMTKYRDKTKAARGGAGITMRDLNKQRKKPRAGNKDTSGTAALGGTER